MKMTTAHAHGPTRTPTIGIIGTGFGGLAAAIELKRAGFTDLVLFERAHDVGGVWRANTYPGAACDVPSPYYSFSYAPNPRWPRRFSRQPAILDYLRDIAERYDIRRHIRFGAEVTSAEYDEAAQSWSVRTGSGELVQVDVLVTAVGQLSRPSFPTIKGSKAFGGAAFHSAEWEHSVDLTGKRVAVIGTGASAVQFIPEIQPRVAKLTVFQRSAPYLLPRPDTDLSAWQHRLFARVPWTQKAERGAWWGLTEMLAVAFLYSRPLSKLVHWVSHAHMAHQVPDPELFAKVWPDYPVGCKRILFSSNYLPALTRPNVNVVTDRITEVIDRGIVTEDGCLHEVDVIVYGTGFTASDFLAPMRIRGSGGQDLRERWADGARAYLGMSVPDFPNFFLMYGPNTNLGSGSIVYMLENQARYIRRAVQHIVAIGSAISVRPDVEAAYDAEIQAKMVDGVWSRCTSWYRNASGRITANWPGTQTEYARRTATFDPGEYMITRGRVA